MPVQVTNVGSYFNVTSYYSVGAIWAYENTNAHGGGYLLSYSAPVATVRVYDNLSNILFGFTHFNSWSREAFDSYFENWSGNSTVAASLRANPVKIQFSILMQADQVGSINTWYSLLSNSVYTGAAPIVFEAGHAYIKDSPLNFIAANSNQSLTPLKNWLTVHSANPIYQFYDGTGTANISYAQSSTLYGLLPSFEVASGTMLVIKDGASNLVSFLSGGTSAAYLTVGAKLALSDNAGSIAAAQAVTLIDSGALVSGQVLLVADSAAEVGRTFTALKAAISSISSISIVSGSEIALSYSQYQVRSDVVAKIANADQFTFGITQATVQNLAGILSDNQVSSINVVDTAENIRAAIANLQFNNEKISSLQMLDASAGVLSFNALEVSAYAGVLSKITQFGVISVRDSVDSISANLDAIQDISSHVDSVVVTGAVSPLNISVSQMVRDSSALAKLAAPYTLSLQGTVSSVSANLGLLSGEISKIQSLSLLDLGSNPLELVYSDIANFNALKTKILWPTDSSWESRVIHITNVRVADIVDAYNLSQPSNFKIHISVSDTAQHIQDGLASLEAIGVNNHALEAITITDGGAITLDADIYESASSISGGQITVQDVAVADVAGVLANANVAHLTILDSSSHISDGWTSLSTVADFVGAIALTDPLAELVVDVANYYSSGAALTAILPVTSKISQPYFVKLDGVYLWESGLANLLTDHPEVSSISLRTNASTIRYYWDFIVSLGDQLDQISLTDSGQTLFLTADRLSDHPEIVNKIVGDIRLQIYGSSTFINGMWDQIDTVVNRVSQVSFSDTARISADDFFSHSAAVAKVSSPYYIDGLSVAQAVSYYGDLRFSGIFIEDTAEHLAASLMLIKGMAYTGNGFYRIGIRQTDIGQALTVDLSNFNDIFYALNLFETSYTLAVIDTAQNIAGQLNHLNGSLSRIESIQFLNNSSAPWEISYDQYVSYQNVFDKISSPYSFKLLGVRSETARALEFSSASHIASVEIVDVSYDISRNIDALIQLGDRVESIRFSNQYQSPIELTAAQYADSAQLFAKFSGPYSISVRGVSISTAINLLSQSSTHTISIIDSVESYAANLAFLQSNLVKIPYMEVLGNDKLILSPQQALDYYPLMNRIFGYGSSSRIQVENVLFNELQSLQMSYPQAVINLVDSAANLAVNLSSISSATISSVAISDPQTPIVVKATYLPQQNESLDKIINLGALEITGTAYEISVSMAKLNAINTHISRIKFTDADDTLNLSVWQLISGVSTGGVLTKITTPYKAFIHDSWIEVHAYLRYLLEVSDRITTIYLEYGANSNVELTVAEFNTYASLISKLSNYNGAITIADSASNLNNLDLTRAPHANSYILKPTSLESDMYVNVPNQLFKVDLSALSSTRTISYSEAPTNYDAGTDLLITMGNVTRKMHLVGEGVNDFVVTSYSTAPTTTYAIPVSAIQSIGLSPDGQFLLIKTSNDLQKVAIGSSMSFNGSTVTTTDLTQTMAPTPVFQSNGGVGGYTLPELFTGPASLNLQYQLIETADNAVVIGSSFNDFIKVASANSTGKAVNGGGGSDVIDGGVGSTFVSGGTNHSGSTFFLDGRAPGVSWSTITDFKTGSDKATIWGFVKGVSSVDASFTDPNNEGAGGIYNGLTLHFKNLLPSGQTTGTNADLNSITLSGRTLADIGVSSLQDLNNQINKVTTANEYGQYVINDHLIIGQTQDAQGTHGYLFVY